MSLDPLDLLKSATRQVPGVRRVWYAIGTAAALVLIYSLLSGYTQGAIVFGVGLIFTLVIMWILIGSVRDNRHMRLASNAIIWIVTIAFGVFVAGTVSAFLVGWPCQWAGVLGMSSCAGPLSDGGGGQDQDGTVLTADQCPRIPPVNADTSQPGRTPAGSDPATVVWVPLDYDYVGDGKFRTITGYWMRKQKGRTETYIRGHWDVADGQCAWVTGQFAQDLQACLETKSAAECGLTQSMSGS
jgi:hypothetical protein